MGQKVHGKREKEFSKATNYLDIANIFITNRNIFMRTAIVFSLKKKVLV